MPTSNEAGSQQGPRPPRRISHYLPPAPAPSTSSRGGRGGSPISYPSGGVPSPAAPSGGASPSFVHHQVAAANELVHLAPPKLLPLIPQALGTSIHTGVPVVQVLRSLRPPAPPKQSRAASSALNVLGKLSAEAAKGPGAPPGRVTENLAGLSDPRITHAAKQFAGSTDRQISRLSGKATEKIAQGAALRDAHGFHDPAYAYAENLLPKGATGLRGAIETAATRGDSAKLENLKDLSRLAMQPAPKPKPKQSLVGGKARSVLADLIGGKAGRAGQKVLTGAFGQKPKPKKTYPYLSPFAKAQSVNQSRVDRGVDYTGTGAISAIGKARYLGVGQGPGWESGGGGGQGYGVLYKLLKGPKAGQTVYTYEGIDPPANLPPVGGILHKGQKVGSFTPGGSIETGWANRSGADLTDARGHSYDPSSHYAQEGRNAYNFLSKLGATTAVDAGGAPTTSGVNIVPLTKHKVSFRGGGGFGANAPIQSPQVQRAIKQVVKVSGTTAPDVAKTMLAASIKYGRKTGIPPSWLAAVGKVENNLGNRATSSAGAQGYMQFMPGTRDTILKKYGVDAFGGPAEAVHAAALLLKDSGGAKNPGAAVANYNPGAGPPGASWYENEVRGWQQKFSALDGASGGVGALGSAPAFAGGTGAYGSAAAGAAAAATGVPTPVANQAAKQAREQNKPQTQLVQLTPPNAAAVPFPQALAALFGGAFPANAGGASGPASGMSTSQLATLLAALQSQPTVGAANTPLAALLGRRRP